jgi:hypothetical protein
MAIGRVRRRKLMIFSFRKIGWRQNVVVPRVWRLQSELRDVGFDQVGQKQMREK